MGKYLITGAAGFIASRVSEMLVADGHTVIGIDNLNDAYDVRLKDWRLHQLAKRQLFRFHRVDLCDRELLRAFWVTESPFDGVVHLAGRAGVRQSVADPWIYQETNLIGTLNLLELCRGSGIGRFVFASTSSVYGNHNPMPFREDADTNRPLSPYAVSKKAAETLCYTYHHLYGLDVTVFRYFTVYGPAGRPDMSLFRFVQRIAEGRPVTVTGDGSQSRDFTFVDDIAQGTILGLQKCSGFQVINLGSDRPHTLLSVLHLIEHDVGRPAQITFQPFPATDVAGTWADISRAREALGWEPRTSIEAGVRALTDWYRANQAWAADIITD